MEAVKKQHLNIKHKEDPRTESHDDKWGNILSIALFALILLLLFFNIMSSSEAIASRLNSSAESAQGKPSSDEIPSAYLACYALDLETKAACHKYLAAKYIKAATSTDALYIRDFAYGAEKMGFEEFLKQHGKSCQSVAKGPLYNEELGGYEVVCTSGEQYIMRFDNEQGSWNLEE